MAYVVLIADDNADNILLIRRIVRRSGIECEFIDAQGGREALRLATARVPDIIFLDMKMPDMDGYEAASALKSNESTKHIPIIAVTAQAMLGDKERALAAGCDEYMTKPVDPVELVETMKKHISKEASGG